MNVCNIEYDNELNVRMNTRTFPSCGLKPNFSFRPVSTKYSYFQTLEEKPEPSVQLKAYKPYNNNNCFVPNTDSKPPCEGYFNDINVESLLRNQFMALQKCDQASYIPDSNSSMFMGKSHNILNRQYNVSSVPNPRCNLAPKRFNNTTKMNIKNL